MGRIFERGRLSAFAKEHGRRIIREVQIEGRSMGVDLTDQEAAMVVRVGTQSLIATAGKVGISELLWLLACYQQPVTEERARGLLRSLERGQRGCLL